MDIKLCKDCKFYGTSENPAYRGMEICSKQLVCPVSGNFAFDDLNVYQARRDYCGISAIYFESKKL